MSFHILNGDSLAQTFAQSNIPGHRIICRECLIDGPAQAADLDNFWSIRANFIAQGYGEAREKYYDIVVKELDQIQRLPEEAEINLWFEDDLFCQSNMWFMLALLVNASPQLKIYRVFPMEPELDHWNGFGRADAASLEQAYAQRVQFHQTDLELGLALWEAFRSKDLKHLQVLSRQPSACFNRLPEVVQAHVDRFAPQGQLGRPERLIAEILQGNPEDFNAIFKAFGQKAGVYGFGDVQVKVMYERVLGMEELI